ncbi:hypothetical protein KACC15558_28710 [Brevibacterium ammoniilyticum]|uniref:Amino acid permease n=1 Tax=Brevibacterium ammoniilyticum TaxID=1046555 RepID=A0ABP9U2K9_9MICO
MSHSERTTAEGAAESEQPETLKRVMGPKLLLLFIVGDILGTGVYALTGKVAGQVGGAGWLPVILAFAVAMITACSYMELVTKYPRAAGAALYTHKAFGIHFITFLVAFAVLSSGITSASTASNVFAANMVAGFGWDLPDSGTMWIALGFLAIVAPSTCAGSRRACGSMSCSRSSSSLVCCWSSSSGSSPSGRATRTSHV